MPPDPHVFFVDASLGPGVAARLKAAGLEIVYHDEVFQQQTPDEEWLQAAGRNGWVVLTKDRRIRYKPNERAALEREGVRQFRLVAGNLTGPAIADAFIAAIPVMRACLETRPGFFIAHLSKAGKLTGTIHSS